MPRSRTLLSAYALAFFLCVLLVASRPATADDGGVRAADAALQNTNAATADAASDASEGVPVDTGVELLLTRARQVADLLAASLDPEVQPHTLFDIDIDSEKAIFVEVARLTAVLRDLDTSDDAGVRAGAKKNVPARSKVLAPAQVDAAASPTNLLDARLALDRARVSYYMLPTQARAALLDAHAQRQAAARAARIETDAQRREREFNEARLRALDAAKRADTEAERIVSEERAHLLGVEGQQSAYGAKLDEGRKRISDRREQMLKWQRRMRELRDAKERDEREVDTAYDDLRAALRASRATLEQALDAEAADVPNAGGNRLAELHLETEAIRAQRKVIENETDRLSTARTALNRELLAFSMEETKVLNRERLALLPFLSKDKRDAITGFSSAGKNQAGAELFQLKLILLYHKHVAAQWLREFRNSPAKAGVSAARAVLVLFEWSAVALAFLWWRKRAPVLLRATRARVRENDRIQRSATPSNWVGVLDFVISVRGPLEWLLLVRAMNALLPGAVSSLLEVELLMTVFTWTFAGSLIVETIDTLVAAGPFARLGKTANTADLRHRSLRLVGRVIVTFGVILVLSSRLVGEGTVYEWVLSTCWFAALPIFVLLIRMWRKAVFSRLGAVRKPSAFERWVLAHQNGWASFFAASSGGLYLFVFGTFRAVRAWVSRFEITRKALAYLFRRRLDKLGEEKGQIALEPLPADVFDALGPATAPEAFWVDTDLDEHVTSLVARIRARRGGIVVLVGERGMGKSRTLARIRAQSETGLTLETPPNGIGALYAAVAKEVGLSSDAKPDELAKALTDRAGSAIMLDDFHRFVQPVMGGLRAFDEIMALAGRHCAETTWIFTFDSVLWQFLKRARAARPVFDEIVHLQRWGETEIAALIRGRTARVELVPNFVQLLEQLPPNADEVDLQEAQEARAESYYRLIWDHSSGNPGIALHMWRRSLGIAPNGDAQVRIFQSLDMADLERLPDSSVFVLRAIMQLAPATADALTRATMMRPSDVNDALRYAVARGYVEGIGNRYTITWTWFRAATRFLQRRHLLGES